jgi:hypothetical protein
MIVRTGSPVQSAATILCAVLLTISVGLAQTPAGPVPGAADTNQAAPLPVLSPDQLDNLVAPIALYPDPLLGQVLAASTYPLEIIEAQQWLQQNGNLQGTQLVDAAKQQNWDPSVQALVVFPDALQVLANDVRWTTDLGNAFLAQQTDVMSAVQRMRARASANGRLTSNAQEVVTTDTQDNQSAIEIQPADPQVIYVPVYDPAYVWGPPAWGAYPDLWYPDGFGFGFGFSPGIYVSSFFPGWGGWGGWGWGCGWFGNGLYGNGLFVNTGFFNRYGFRGRFAGRGFGGRNFGGRGAWAHDPGHRRGVAYPNRTVASRFNSNRFNSGRTGGAQFSGNRGQVNAGRSGGNRANAFAGGNRSGNNQFTGGSRANAGQVTGGRSNVSRQGTPQSNRRTAGVAGGTSANTGGWRQFNGDNRAATNGSAGTYRQASRNTSTGVRAQTFSASGQTGRANSSAVRGQSSSAARSYAQPRQNYSAPRQSYSAPRQNFAARQSYSPQRQSFSAPRQSFSAPRQSFSAPRSGGGSGGGSRGFSGGGTRGLSGGHSGSGGHAGGGGGRHR